MYQLSHSAQGGGEDSCHVGGRDKGQGMEASVFGMLGAK